MESRRNNAPQSPLVVPQEGGENRHAVRQDAAKINAEKGRCIGADNSYCRLSLR
jgi:hypothetical protein